jgi:hypothetical protein
VDGTTIVVETVATAVTVVAFTTVMMDRGTITTILSTVAVVVTVVAALPLLTCHTPEVEGGSVPVTVPVTVHYDHRPLRTIITLTVLRGDDLRDLPRHSITVAVHHSTHLSTRRIIMDHRMGEGGNATWAEDIIVVRHLLLM